MVCSDRTQALDTDILCRKIRLLRSNSAAQSCVLWRQLGVLLLVLLVLMPVIASGRRTTERVRDKDSIAWRKSIAIAPLLKAGLYNNTRLWDDQYGTFEYQTVGRDDDDHEMVELDKDEAYFASLMNGPSEGEAWNILQTIYDSLGGPYWLHSYGWLQPNVPLCDWWGIECLPRNRSKDFSPIIVLDLRRNNLTGQIPAEVAHLTTLHILDLSHNNIYGTLPDNIGNMTLLGMLHVPYNFLNGTLPESLGALARLTCLDISHNCFNSPLPDALYNISTLRYVNMSYNSFKEQLSPHIGHLYHLKEIDIGHNAFFGHLPRSVGNLTNLLLLDLSFNSFTGNFSKAITRTLLNLQVLVAGYNNFTGDTEGLGYLINARKILMDHNSLTGELHPYLTELSQIIALDLRSNQLQGQVPESVLFALLQNTQLMYLNLMNNHFLVSVEGRIPPFLASDPHTTSHVGIGSYVCHRLYLHSSSSTSLMVDPAFFNWKHCACVRDSYGLPPEECYNCPPGAYCNGGSSFTFESGWYPIIEPPGSNGTGFKPHWNIPTYSREYGYLNLPDGQYKKPKLPSRPDPEDGHVKHPSPPPKNFLAGPVVLYPCPELTSEQSACNPDSNSTFRYNSSTTYGVTSNATLCAPGYDRRLCSFCTCAAASNPACFGPPPGPNDPPIGDCSCYYRASYNCVKCSQVWNFSSLVALSVALWLTIVAIMTFTFYSRKVPAEASLLRFDWIAKIWRKLPKGLRHSGYLKIVVLYSQTLSVVSKDPKLAYFKIFTGDIFSLGAVCAWPILSHPYWQLLIYFILPLALLFALVVSLAIAAALARLSSSCAKPQEAIRDEDFINDHLIYGGGSDTEMDVKMVESESKTTEYSLIYQGFSVTLAVYWLFLFGSVYKALSVFNCSPDPMSSFIETQPWLGCQSPEYRSLQILAILALVVYCVLVPVGFASLLFVFRNRINESGISTILEILCASYRSRVFWYEMVVTVRRILFAAVLALVPAASAWKMSFVCFVIVVGLYLQILFRPFVTGHENILEELAMVTVLLTYAAQYAWSINFNSMADVNTVNIVVNFLLLACVLYTYVSRTFFPQYRFLPWSPKPQVDDEASMSTISTESPH